MSASGHGAQVVKVREDHTYELDVAELESVLLQDGIKDLPVVVVSVAGSFRRGKSFLLNFFLRYLTAPTSAREDGSWLGEDSQPLTGFSWRSGSKRNTTGILLWSEPVLMALPTGDKVAVLLMDTQGTFDSQSTVRDCSTIFALSTLLSSVQIYNLSGNIQEDDLQHLQLFTEYGRIVRDREGSKAFQVLEFLVRDWQNPDEFEYGASGGDQFLLDKLKITPNMPQEMKDLRKHITSCFEKVSCFLMPHPGLKVTRKAFHGEISDIDPDFRQNVKALVAALFTPEKLMPKRVNGELVRARELCAYFKTYMELFNSDQIPTTSTIMEATVRAGMLAAVDEARHVYQDGMDAECGPDRPSVPADDLEDLHNKYLAIARAAFTTKKKMGSPIEADTYLDKLTEDLGNELPLYRQSNVAKAQEAINDANRTYEATVAAVTHGDTLLLHPTDLLRLHERAYAAATKLFDAARRRISTKKDVERDLFQKSLNMRYPALRKLNEQNHNTLIVTLRLQYSERMQARSEVEPPLSAAELQSEHDLALADAVKHFDDTRNVVSQYEEDVFKYNLTTEITKTFVIMKKTNSSKNKVALRTALQVYNDYMAGNWDHGTAFLHPNQFEKYDKAGRCRALDAFRPRKTCSQGFDLQDEDERTLNDMINQRYDEMKRVNDSANESAVQEAYHYYYSRMEELCRPIEHSCSTEHKSYDTKLRFHNNTFKEAVGSFNYKQRFSDSYYDNYYRDNLKQMMQREFDNHAKNY